MLLPTPSLNCTELKMAKPLRVLMMSQYPLAESDHRLGGIMQTTYQLVSGFIELADPDLDLRLLSLNENCTKPVTRRYGNVTVHHIPKSVSPFGFIFSEPFRLLYHYLKLLFSFRPHIVHAQGNVSFIMLSLLYGRRSIQTVHGVFRNEQKTIPTSQRTASMRLRFLLRESIESFYFATIRTIIVTSTQLVILAQQAGGKPKKIVWIDNSVDKAFFVEPAPRTTEAQLTLLFVGLITPRKGLHFLLPAFAKLVTTNPDMCLRIIGIFSAAPDYVAELKKTYAALIETGQLIFTGGVDQSDLIKEYGNADIFVLPSLGETAPVAISQAMCAGLPVISTQIGGIPDMIADGENGFVVAPASSEALEKALQSLIGDRAKARAMGDNGRRFGVIRYHPVSNAGKTMALYRETAEAKG
jgi:glycosyltransferase involved in cell wall biosynthesis